jgi:HAD superfamily hydrolase (TIGR01549 family)
MSVFSTVLFDLGSTLIYFDAEWEPVMREAAEVMHRKLVEMGFALDESFPGAYRATSREAYRWRDEDMVETPAPVVLRKVLATFGYADPTDEQIHEALAALYAVSQSHWHVEDDAVSTLQELLRRGYRLGLISNAGYDEDVQILIDKAALRPYLQFIISSAACRIRKPHPRIFQMALDSLGVQAGEAVMVGDFLAADVLGANSMGMGSVWITRRADPVVSKGLREVITPQRTISTLAELPGVLENWDRAA